MKSNVEKRIGKAKILKLDKNELLAKAATIPDDIIEIILSNPEWIKIIRDAKAISDGANPFYVWSQK